MALTAQQIVDVRRYCGYSVSGNATFYPYRELVYSNVSYFGLTLDSRLANLSAEEENTVVTYFLLHLPLREAEIQAASDNLDTERAAVWTRNAQEVADRRELYGRLRLDLCSFLGFAPGRGLLTGRMVRA